MINVYNQDCMTAMAKMPDKCFDFLAENILKN